MYVYALKVEKSSMENTKGYLQAFSLLQNSVWSEADMFSNFSWNV